MKALLGTSLFAPLEVYDTGNTSQGAISKFLKPYVLIEDDSGNVLYTVGTPVGASIIPLVIVAGLAAALLLIIVKRR